MQIQVYKESNISVYAKIMLFFIVKILTCEITYSDNAHMCFIARNRKNLNKIYDDEGFAFLLYECTCNTKVTRILFNIYQPSNMLYINNITKQRRKYVLRS